VLFYPGGKKILEAIKSQLSLSIEDPSFSSRKVLSEFKHVLTNHIIIKRNCKGIGDNYEYICSL